MAEDGKPTWSPDSGQIAFDSERSGNKDIWIIPATGGTAIPLTTDPADDDDAAWSPLGDEIAFGSERGGVSQNIWIASDLPSPVLPATWGAIKAHYR
jgi:Tol biopolymer transport system component